MATKKRTSGNDRLSGTTGANLVRGFAGNDIQNRLSGDDDIQGRLEPLNIIKRRPIMHGRTRKILTLAAGFLAASAIMQVAPAQADTNHGKVLEAGQTMFGGDYMQNGRARLVMRTDGTLRLYYGSRVCASSNTIGNGTHAIMQYDGNFVVYNGRAPVWRSATTGPTWQGSDNRLSSDGTAYIRSPRKQKKEYWSC